MEYKKRLVTKLQEEKKFKEDQDLLRKRYHVKEEGIITVKKKGIVEILIREVIRVLKWGINTVVIILAAICLTALFYPGPRTEILNMLIEIGEHMKMNIGW